MNLDDFKSTWDNGGHLQNPPGLTTKWIDTITKRKYISKINRIAYPEMIGTVVCLAGALFICTNLSWLQSMMLQAAGLLSVILLVMISLISYRSIRALNAHVDMQQPYAAVLNAFAIQKIKFFRLQKVNSLLGYVLLVTMIIFILQFYGGAAVERTKYFWAYAFSAGYLFLFFCARRVARFYNKLVRQAEALLKDATQED